ncbi:MAG: hydrogenase iron-sulfur subunit [Candidatus Bathyarchaeota archaeon]|nr:MAG: hydrogenase iron-sulfur subunit [Candidatus Bathyarchaeota archaeon]
METKEPKVGVFLSDSGKQLSNILDFHAITNFVKGIPGVVYVAQGSDFWHDRGLENLVETVKSKKIDRVVVAGTTPKLSEVKIAREIEKAGLNPYLMEYLDLKDHCAMPHRSTPAEATEKAKAMLAGSVERAKLLEPLKKLEFPSLKSALVIGGGIAGMQTAIDLADLGFQVNLVEREPFLGGLAARAGRFFPTDDCAICIQPPSSDVKTITHTSRKCVYRSGFSEVPNLAIHTKTRVLAVEGEPGNYSVTIEKTPRYIDEDKCINCDKCTKVCPVEVPDEYNGKLTKRKAVYSNIPSVHPPIYTIDENSCKFHDCARCVEACPTGAVKLDQKPEKTTINVGSIIVATGFEEFDSSVIKEYHYNEYPDVITNLQLARMIDNFGPTKGAILRPSNHQPAKKIVFVQCVGSRDQRYKLYCSSICCMISLKHATIIKSAFPDTDVTICYIDMRTTGREHEYYYEKARDMGIKFVKGRPTEITKSLETDKLVVDTEAALLHRMLQVEADLVVIAPAMIPAKGTEQLAEVLGVDLDIDGFFKEYNAKLRPTETKLRGIYICGGATFPKDAPTTSLHAHSAAIKAAKFLNASKITKDQRTAVIDQDFCGDCEFCPATCPYQAISVERKDEEHLAAKVSDLLCEGCGICVGACPLGAIELRHARPSQMKAQMKGLMSVNGTSSPLILAICCSECGHTAVDSSGMAMMEYPANVRVMRVPCTGIVQVQQILEAFKAGAQGVMVVGCKTEGCHYEAGSEKAEKKVDMTKILLQEYGVDPERLEMFKMVFIEGREFAEAARNMTERLQKLGRLNLIPS